MARRARSRCRDTSSAARDACGAEGVRRARSRPAHAVREGEADLARRPQPLPCPAGVPGRSRPCRGRRPRSLRSRRRPPCRRQTRVQRNLGHVRGRRGSGMHGEPLCNHPVPSSAGRRCRRPHEAAAGRQRWRARAPRGEPRGRRARCGRERQVLLGGGRPSVQCAGAIRARAPLGLRARPGRRLRARGRVGRQRGGVAACQQLLQQRAQQRRLREHLRDQGVQRALLRRAEAAGGCHGSAPPDASAHVQGATLTGAGPGARPVRRQALSCAALPFAFSAVLGRAEHAVCSLGGGDFPCTACIRAWLARSRSEAAGRLRWGEAPSHVACGCARPVLLGRAGPAACLLCCAGCVPSLHALLCCTEADASGVRGSTLFLAASTCARGVPTPMSRRVAVESRWVDLVCTCAGTCARAARLISAWPGRHRRLCQHASMSVCGAPMTSDAHVCWNCLRCRPGHHARSGGAKVVGREGCWCEPLAWFVRGSVAGVTRLRWAAALGLPASSARRPAVRSAAAARACAPAVRTRVQGRRVLLRRRLGLRRGRGGVQERAQLQVRRAWARGLADQPRR
jgi:hypothetical protein